MQRSEPTPQPPAPSASSDTAIQIDAIVTATAVRAIWTALAAYDNKLKDLLQAAMNDEVSGLLLNQELNESHDNETTNAVVQLLSAFVKVG